VAPQLQLVGLDRMDAELSLFTRANVLGPDVTEQAVRQQPEVVRLIGLDGHLHALGPEAGLLQRDAIVAGRQVGVDRSAGARAGAGAGLDGLRSSAQRDKHAGKGPITSNPDKTNAHWRPKQNNKPASSKFPLFFSPPPPLCGGEGVGVRGWLRPPPHPQPLSP